MQPGLIIDTPLVQQEVNEEGKNIEEALQQQQAQRISAGHVCYGQQPQFWNVEQERHRRAFRAAGPQAHILF